MKRLVLYFEAPGQVTVREQELPVPGEGQVLVRSIASATSPGTELLVYRGQFSEDIPVDTTIAALSGKFAYPMRYGYCSVGQVDRLGAKVNPEWEGKLVFVFHPHASHFLTEIGALHPVPDGISLEDALFLANMETAVNLVMDGAPLIGEKVVVFGQGIVGLLTVALLSRFPLAELLTLDCYPLRRQASLDTGAHACLDPNAPHAQMELRERLGVGSDLVYELSGSPEALDQAISIAAYDAKVVIGSWYGRKRANLDLGGWFHRSRIRLVSSQVSTIAPVYQGRWSKARRFELAWELTRVVKPSRFITHRFPIDQAQQAYHLLDNNPGEAIQVIFDYA